MTIGERMIAAQISSAASQVGSVGTEIEEYSAASALLGRRMLALSIGMTVLGVGQFVVALVELFK